MGNLEPSCFRPQGMGKGPRCGSLTKRPGEVLVWRLKSGKQEESVGGSSQSRWSPPLVPGDIPSNGVGDGVGAGEGASASRSRGPRLPRPS